MKRLVRSFLFLSALSLAGQNLFTVTTSDGLKSDSWQEVLIRVTNNSDSPITGLRVESMCAMRSGAGAPKKLVRIDDPLVRILGTGAAIPAGSSTEYRSLAGVPAPFEQWSCRGSVAAALFADGTSIGDRAIIDRLRRDRVLMAAEVEWHLRLFSEAAQEGHSRDTVLTAMADHQTAIGSPAPGAIYPSLDAYTNSQVYQAVAVNLKNGVPLNTLLFMLQPWKQRLDPALLQSQERSRFRHCSRCGTIYV